jgi:LCP family protein required for cell wall assembly
MSPTRKTSRALRITTSISLGIVAIAAIGWLGLGQVSGSLNRINAFDNLKNRPAAPTNAVNFLLVGSDNRTGLTKAEIRELAVGGTDVAAGGRSDSILLVHISKKRDSAVILSFPRDSVVTIPEHVSSSDSTKIVPARQNKLNAAFSFGGAPLLISTLEGATGLRIDHYIEINFLGFRNMINALGGIDVCVKKDINDKKSALVLAKGLQTLDGVQALKYVRTRYFDGLGDLGRIQRQQEFMSAVLRKATSSGTLLNPIKLINFLNTAIKTVTTDQELNKNDLLTLGKQLKNLSANRVRTLTVPLSNANGRVSGLGSVVIWDEVLAPELFTRLLNDESIVDEVVATPSPSGSPSGSSSGSSSGSVTAKPTSTIIDKFGTKNASDNSCAPTK